jgi:prokaryotic ubiquitin-like protein Pup
MVIRKNAKVPGADDSVWGVVGAADQPQKQKPKKGGEGDDEAGEEGPQKMAQKGEALKEEMDALVDEIDEVLEENAEEFVKNYVQRGGE